MYRIPATILLILAQVFMFPGVSLGVSGLDSAVAGRIVLQVEQNGEAWYVSPDTLERYYLGRPADAFALMREQGIGITGANLARLPIGILGSGQPDSDGDGLADNLEQALSLDPLKPDSDSDGFSDAVEVLNGHDPRGSGVFPIDRNFARVQAGHIFLAVEGHGEAWYLNPADGRRYYLGRPADAFAAMRQLGLGITDRNLAAIRMNRAPQVAGEMSVPEYVTNAAEIDLRQLEFYIMELVNHERLNAGEKALKWNSDLANVAREHSANLAAENDGFTGYDRSCDYPIIHHEGRDFGPYNADRLAERGVHYYSRAGENIALVSAASITVRAREDDPVLAELDECPGERELLDNNFRSALDGFEDVGDKIGLIAKETALRENLYRGRSTVTVADTEWFSELAIARDTVKGWMDSPGHRENILTADYDETGVGAAYVNGYVITTQSFITRADCGFEDGPCCEKSGYRPYCFVPLNASQDILCATK